MSSFIRHGLEVGKDISVVANDCTRVRSSELPTLTAAGASPEKMGGVAAEIVLDETQRPYFQDIVIEAEFFQGESTGPVKC